MGSSFFQSKKQDSDLLTLLVKWLEAWFLEGNSLNSCSDSGSQKKLPLVMNWIRIFWGIFSLFIHHIGNLVMYPKICLILQHLSPLFYWKSSLKNLTDQIMIPIKDVKKPLKNEMKTTILKCLPNAISGICKSTKNLDKDEFIKNSLRNVFKEVMEKFNVQDLTEFFYLILNHEEDRLSDLIFRVIFFTSRRRL